MENIKPITLKSGRSQIQKVLSYRRHQLYFTSKSMQYNIKVTTWCHTVMVELSEVKLTLGEAQHFAQDKAKWREIVVALCPHRGQ